MAGLTEAKVEVKEFVEFLHNPEKIAELGGKIPKVCDVFVVVVIIITGRSSCRTARNR